MMGIGYQELFVLFVLGIPYFFATFALVPYVASEKGRGSGGWALTAMFLTPVLALIALAAIPDKLEEKPDVSDVSEFKWRKE